MQKEKLKNNKYHIKKEKFLITALKELLLEQTSITTMLPSLRFVKYSYMQRVALC